MTNYRCPKCLREKETDKRMAMVICNVCRIEMKEFPLAIKKNEVEIYE